MYSHEIDIRVRYGETDQMGVVYYGNYCLYYEVARVEVIRSLGITYRSLEEAGILMPVVRVESKFIHGAEYDDLIRIKSTVVEMPDRFIIFDVEMFREELKIHEAKVVLCFKDAKTGKRVRTPQEIISKLTPHFLP